MEYELCFRYAVAADFQAVVELACQLARHIEAKLPPLTIEQFEKYYLSANAPMRLLLAIHQDKIVGMISWTLTHELYSAETRVYISDLSVDRGARGKGVGAALMKQVTEWAHAHDVSKMGWEVWYKNFTAKVFYERMGAYIDAEAVPYLLALKDAKL